jgi:transposase
MIPSFYIRKERIMSIYVRSLTKEEELELNSIARNGTDVKFSRRAQVILASNAKTPVPQIAKVLGYSDLQVRRILHSFDKEGIDGIRPNYQGGRPFTFSERQRRAVVELAESRPKDLGYPLTQWSLSQIQLVLIKEKKLSYISRPTIRTILKEAGLSYQRTKTWKESNDVRFEKKTDYKETV